MESSATRQHFGFTLIELLVVIGVVALLMGFLLPVLGHARRAGRGVQCSSNLAQMMRGWEVTVAEMGGTVDVEIVYPVAGVKRWPKWLGSSVGLPVLPPSGSARSGYLVCPEIESAFSGPAYMNPVCGYAINALRRPNQLLDDSNHFLWDILRMPSAYPWFADLAVDESDSPPLSHRDYFGNDSTAGWSLGYHHPLNTGRTAFADGHVEVITPEVLAGPVDTMGTPLWLLDAP
ncbi:MAG: type II secretion system protein [Algisphaera sp.]